MPKSRLLEEMVAGGDTDGRKITAAQADMASWFTDKGYDLAVQGAPHDSGEGGYLGTIDADDLMEEYLAANPAQEKFRQELTEHCYELGPLFNPDKWHFNNDPPPPSDE